MKALSASLARIICKYMPPTRQKKKEKKTGQAKHYGTRIVPLKLTAKNMMQIIMVKKIAILTSKLPECAHGEHNYGVTSQKCTTESNCYEVVQLHTCMCKWFGSGSFFFPSV